MFSQEFILGSEAFLVEILLENDQKENRKMECFSSYKSDKLDGLFFFLKVKNLHSKAEVNDKITLKEAIRAIKERTLIKKIEIAELSEITEGKVL